MTDFLKSSAAVSNDDYLNQMDAPDTGSNAWKAVLLALVLVVGGIGAYVYFGEQPPVADGEVIRVTAIPIHTESRMAPAAGMPGQNEVFDQVLVMAQVKIHNQSKGPLFLHDMWAVLTLPDGLERRSMAVNRGDYSRAFIAYPQLAPLRMDPIVREITLEPGQTVEGMMLFPYPMTRDQYDQMRALDINVSFLHQKTLTMRAPQ